MEPSDTTVNLNGDFSGVVPKTALFLDKVRRYSPDGDITAQAFVKAVRRECYELDVYAQRSIGWEDAIYSKGLGKHTDTFIDGAVKEIKEAGTWVGYGTGHATQLAETIEHAWQEVRPNLLDQLEEDVDVNMRIERPQRAPQEQTNRGLVGRLLGRLGL
jgi:hypothetical protein